MSTLDKKCDATFCENVKHAKGFCKKHYERFRIHGDPSIVKKPGPLPGNHSRSYKHGKTKTRIYTIWVHMRGRCENPNDRRYRDYGGRGIKVCERWKSFTNFYKDMSESYSDSLTLDRIDNDGDYCPENCRWTTYKTQSNNKRNNLVLTYRGETHTLTEWAEKLGVNKSSLGNRIKKYGWTVEEALSIPLTGKKRIRGKKKREAYQVMMCI